MDIDHSIFNRTEIPDYATTVIQDHFKTILKQQTDFIKSKIIEKGFGHLLVNIERKKFPKLMAIKIHGWTYYYADNDTDDGAFIVAIAEFDFMEETSDPNFRIKMTTSFKWQDTEPLCII